MEPRLHLEFTWPAGCGADWLVLEADRSGRQHRVFISQSFEDDRVGSRVWYAFSFYINLELDLEGLHEWCQDNAMELATLADLLLGGSDDPCSERKRRIKELERSFYEAMSQYHFGFFPWC